VDKSGRVCFLTRGVIYSQHSSIMASKDQPRSLILVLTESAISCTVWDIWRLTSQLH